MLPELDAKIEKIADGFLHRHVEKVLLVAMGINQSFGEYQADRKNGQAGPMLQRLETAAMEAADGWLSDKLPQFFEQALKIQSQRENITPGRRSNTVADAYEKAFRSAFDDHIRKTVANHAKNDAEGFANKLFAEFLEKEMPT